MKTETIAIVVVAAIVLLKYGSQFQQPQQSNEFDRPSISMVTKVNGVEVKLRGNPDSERIAYLFLHSASIADDARSFADLRMATATLTKGLEDVGGTHAPGIRDDVDRLFRDYVGTEGQLDASARSRWREACQAVAWAAHRASNSGGFFQVPVKMQLPRIEWSQHEGRSENSITEMRPSQLMAYADSGQGDDYDWRKFTGGARKPSDSQVADIPNFRDLKQKKKRDHDTSLIH